MPKITTRDEARAAQDLPFCYLCGRSFTEDDDPNRDHVPPTSIFLEEDRDFPLWLPTHASCNEAESKDDQLIGQLFGFVHGRPPSEEHFKLEFQRMEDTTTGDQTVGLADSGLKRVVFRWIRAFHAALYQEYLPADLPHKAIEMPFPSGTEKEDGLHWDSIREQHPMIVHDLKKASMAHTVDPVLVCNEKCRYECTWALSDHGESWVCLFGLKLYDWSRIGDASVAEERGCVGIYAPLSGKPATASEITRLELSVENLRRLQPFDE